MWCPTAVQLLLLPNVVCAGSPHNDQAVFQPSAGLFSGRSFDTALKVPRPPAGWITQRVVLEVPQGIEDVRPETKPGWSAFRAPGVMVFESSDSAETALEFQLRLRAGCEFVNGSQAVDMAGMRVLLWRMVQHLRGEGAGNSSAADASDTLQWTPWTSVTSSSTCGGATKGMIWLGRFVPPEEGLAKASDQKRVVGIEEDRTFDGSDYRRHDHSADHRKGGMRGGHAGMVFGSPNPGGQKVQVHQWRKIQEAIGTLGLVMFVVLLGSVALAVAMAFWAKLLFFYQHGAPGAPKGPLLACCHGDRGRASTKRRRGFGRCADDWQTAVSVPDSLQSFNSVLCRWLARPAEPTRAQAKRGPAGRQKRRTPGMWKTLLLVSAWTCQGLYDEVHHIASARLYGNVHDYAYYFLDLSIGTPPQRVSVIVDTGSSITGFPCKSCEHCGQHIDPLFEITQSRTASWVKCNTKNCHGFCSADQKHCTYRQSLPAATAEAFLNRKGQRLGKSVRSLFEEAAHRTGERVDALADPLRFTEGSSFHGWWFEDLVRLGDLMQQNPPLKALVGCHQEETRLFYTQKANGIMGIRYPKSGAPTLLQQLLRDREHISEDIFTMCIAESGGRLTVGGMNTSYHRGEMIYLDMDFSNGFFNVPLRAIHVDGQEATSGPFGSTVIDSGTTWSYFGSQPYEALRKAIDDFCKSRRTCGAQSGCCCFDVSGDLSGFPELKMSFDDVETKWVPQAYLYRRGQAKRWCYSFQNDGPGANTVLGASWMMHQDVMFDIPRKRVGVVAATCPEYQVRPEHDLAQLTNSEEADEELPPGEGAAPPPSGLRVQATTTKKKRFNIGILWAGLAAGICLATGFIGVAAAACGSGRVTDATPPEKSSGRRSGRGLEGA
eukprot:s554_g1.t2